MMFPHDSALRNLKSKDKQACLEKRPFLAFFGVKHSTSPRNALWHERLEVLFTLILLFNTKIGGYKAADRSACIYVTIQPSASQLLNPACSKFAFGKRPDPSQPLCILTAFTVNLHHAQPVAWQATWPSML